MPQAMRYIDMYARGLDKMIEAMAAVNAVRRHSAGKEQRVVESYEALVTAGFTERELRAMLAIALDRLAVGRKP